MNERWRFGLAKCRYKVVFPELPSSSDFAEDQEGVTPNARLGRPNSSLGAEAT